MSLDPMTFAPHYVALRAAMRDNVVTKPEVAEKIAPHVKQAATDSSYRDILRTLAEGRSIPGPADAPIRATRGAQAELKNVLKTVTPDYLIAFARATKDSVVRLGEVRELIAPYYQESWRDGDYLQMLQTLASGDALRGPADNVIRATGPAQKQLETILMWESVGG